MEPASGARVDAGVAASSEPPLVDAVEVQVAPVDRVDLEPGMGGAQVAGLSRRGPHDESLSGLRRNQVDRGGNTGNARTELLGENRAQ